MHLDTRLLSSTNAFLSHGCSHSTAKPKGANLFRITQATHCATGPPRSYGSSPTIQGNIQSRVCLRPSHVVNKPVISRSTTSSTSGHARSEVRRNFGSNYEAKIATQAVSHAIESQEIRSAVADALGYEQLDDIADIVAFKLSEGPENAGFRQVLLFTPTYRLTDRDENSEATQFVDELADALAGPIFSMCPQT